MKLKNAPLIGRIMMIVGSLSIILQVIANKTVDLISKKESSLTNTEKVLIKFRGLLLGSETKIELPSFGSFIGFVWLGLLGIVLFSVGFRIMREERVEA